MILDSGLLFLSHPVVCNAGRRTLSSDPLHHLHWLPVLRRIEFKTATLRFKPVKLGTPSYLTNMLMPHEPTRTIRSSELDLLSLPTIQPRFSVFGP